MSILEWLQDWYNKNCDGYWEHLYGIKIDNIDNPGWSVNIDLKDTSLENKSFSTIKYDIDENDWLFCTIRNGAFNGAGGSKKLEEILLTFKDWAES